jgi:hypothetical protein
MKKHDWVLEEECYGHMGCEDVWVCKDCRADGGLSTYNRDTDKPTLPRHRSMMLPEDCELSKLMVCAFEDGLREGREDEARENVYNNVTRPFPERLRYLFLRTFK